MQIKTATQLLELNTTDLPLQLSGIPRSGSTAAERNIYRQLVIDNPENFPGYVGELLRDIPQFMEYKKKAVPVISKFDLDAIKQNIDLKVERGDDSNFLNDNLGIEASSRDNEVVEDRLNLISDYRYDQYFMKLLLSDLFILGVSNQNKLMDILDNNFWIFTYRKNYVDQIISLLYAFTTGQYHYYENFKGKPLSVNIDMDLVKRLMLVSYSNIGLIWKDRTNVAYVEKQQLTDIEDNTETYNQLDVNRDLLPPKDIIQTPFNLARNKTQMQELVVNYDQCAKMARRMMRVIAKNNSGFIEVSEDEIQLNV